MSFYFQQQASIILYQVPPLFAADFALSIADQPELFVPSIGKLPAGSASSLAFDRLFQAGTRFLHAVQKDLLMVHLSRQQDADLESRNQEDSHFSFLPGQEDIEKAKALTADPLLPLLQKKVISHELGCSIRRISLRILHTMWAEILGHVTTVYLSETPVPPGHQISGDHLPTSIADKVQRRCDGLIAYMSFHSPTLPQSYTYLPSLETLVTDKASAEMHDRFSHLDVAVRDRMDLQMQLPQLMNSVPSLVPITSLPPDG
ncbi:MAG: uncharacterized protein KVP18_003101 [Porospora cf. gigantea A]|uniref:uncharacterized protein n=1 Tax=Porospora cf. gigantea A TaxID=2853593 RepID=UPI003559FAA2|nr:MAG: hypothetical protein KVP18_003101 [Porospora cf. gigantea A]